MPECSAPSGRAGPSIRNTGILIAPCQMESHVADSLIPRISHSFESSAGSDDYLGLLQHDDLDLEDLPSVRCLWLQKPEPQIITSYLKVVFKCL